MPYFRYSMQFLMLRFCLYGSTSCTAERKHVQVLFSYAARIPCNRELWDCRTVCYRRADSFTVAGASFGSRSRVVVSLRRHVQCVVGRSRTGIARDRPLGPGFRLLFPASGVRADSKDPGGPA